MRRWWMKNFFNERNRARRLGLSIMKELKIKNKTASNIDFLNTINAIELSRARCRNITTLFLNRNSIFSFLSSFFFKSKTRLNSFLKTVLSSRKSMVKYEIRHSVANCARIENMKWNPFYRDIFFFLLIPLQKKIEISDQMAE